MAPADPEAALIASGSEEEEGRPAARWGSRGLRGLVAAGLLAAVLGVSVSVEGCGGGDPLDGATRYSLSLTLDDANATNVTFECVAEQGGLVTSLKLGDTSILVESPQPPSGIRGSTFWPSPQSAWGWPPPQEIASDAYNVNETNDSGVVMMTSKPAEAYGIQVQKTFSVDAALKAIVLKYTLTGLSDTAVQYAGWEKPSVPQGGLSFWKAGERAPLHADFPLPLLDEVDGITYVDHANANITDDGVKLASNSTGTWMAHATNETVFVKVFQAVAEGDVAPGEGNIALVAKPTYASMETQGAYTATSIGNPFTYVVCWYVRPLPGDALALPGDEKLLALVTEVAGLGCPEE
mmetsp:Transcript_116256/g.329444  ORF Transcript_116256/g.329444 Transcript_116256/m.329444 type:complete len:351 (-) Transcript_116256:168-1220(-)